MIHYDIYCTNCETVQATSKDALTNDLQKKLGSALSKMMDGGRDGELCCYSGECMMDEHYTVRKAEKKIVYKRLDDA